jgi:hypothetical protein
MCYGRFVDQTDFDKQAREIVRDNLPGATPAQVEEEGDSLAWALFQTAQTRLKDLQAEMDTSWE